MLISRLNENQWRINRLTKVLMVKLVICILSVRSIAVPFVWSDGC